VADGYCTEKKAHGEVFGKKNVCARAAELRTQEARVPDTQVTPNVTRCNSPLESAACISKSKQVPWSQKSTPIQNTDLEMYLSTRISARRTNTYLLYWYVLWVGYAHTSVVKRYEAPFPKEVPRIFATT